MVDTALFYVFRFIAFSAIGFGTVVEFIFIVWRLMLQLGEVFGRESE